MREDADCFSARAQKAITGFGAMLTSFPMNDPLNEEILETLHAVRGKFKTVGLLRLVTWTILAVTWTTPAGSDWCF